MNSRIESGMNNITADHGNRTSQNTLKAPNKLDHTISMHRRAQGLLHTYSSTIIVPKECHISGAKSGNITLF